jgi:hypothetical protein
VEYDIFIREWFKRAERTKQPVDDADRFISLWIAFNGWLKKEYGENTKDTEMIKKAKKNKTLKEKFGKLYASNKIFVKNLEKLMGYRVVDMRDPTNEQKEKRCTGDFESYLDTIYQIRCNLFHGRKNYEESKKDRELVTLALKLLRPLFKSFLENTA